MRRNMPSLLFTFDVSSTYSLLKAMLAVSPRPRTPEGATGVVIGEGILPEWQGKSPKDCRSVSDLFLRRA